jgi:PAS domain S-box-containing protein
VRWWNRLVWRLSAVALLIVVLVIAGTGEVGSMLSRHFALESARCVLHFNSLSIRSGIEKLMMSRNNPGVRGFIEDISRGSTVYHDIRLIAHPSGEIAVSRFSPPGTANRGDDKSCTLCHRGEAPPPATDEPLDFVFAGPHGKRFLQVVAPILNAPSCQTADCHAHETSGPVLGFLQTDYSLEPIDALITSLDLFLALAALLAVIVTAGALLIMFRRYVGNPLRNLVTGLGALASDDLSFRFPAGRKDEIGIAEKSFNRMASRIQTHQGELRSALDYLESIVENSADLIITVNPEGLVQTFNRGAEEALGYKRNEVIGRSINTLFADPRERDAAIARLREKDNVTNYETQFLTKRRDIRHVLLTLSLLRDKEGNPIGTLGISKDVTTEKDLQRKLAQSEQAAAIGRAVTGIQHAIKNMLTTLDGGLYIARVGKRKSNPKQIEEGFAMIEEGLSRITDLSHNLLKYSREWRIEPESTEMADLAEKVVTAVKQTAAARGVALHVDVAPSLPTVRCDPGLIHMGLMDILTNALEACEAKDYEGSESPEVVFRISASADAGEVVIELGDNGVGMTKGVMADIFTPFFSTKKKWGTGLGLALTARIVELHGGEISVDSEPERGATFRITIPVDSRGTNRRQDNG